jgi:hypothetical protein
LLAAPGNFKTSGKDLKMQDPLQEWMTRMKLLDIYHIFQKHGVTIDQVESISTDTLNEMGLNIGQRKRFFTARGRDGSSSSNAPPSYGQVISFNNNIRSLQFHLQLQ